MEKSEGTPLHFDIKHKLFAGLAIALCFAGLVSAETTTPLPPADTPPGKITVLYGDGPNGEQITQYYAADKDGMKPVNLTSKQEKSVQSANALETVQGAKGNLPWVSLMCAFADKPWNDGSHDKSYYQGLMGPSYPGMENYWRDVSYGAVQLTKPDGTGSGQYVFGPFQLPRTQQSYSDEGYPGALWSIAIDCQTAAKDNKVSLDNFYGVNLFLNGNTGCCAWAWDGGVNAITWMPPWSQDASSLPHEEGHGFGLPHSADFNGQTYKNHLDVMSWGGISIDPIYGRVGQHPIADQKLIEDWIPNERIAAVNPGTAIKFCLERLANPRSDGCYLTAKIPVDGSSTHYFTVEHRDDTGYDAGIPDGVYAHEVNRNRQDPAWVMANGQQGNDWFDWVKFIPGMNIAKGDFSLCVNRKLPDGEMEVMVGNKVPAVCDYPFALLPVSLFVNPEAVVPGQTATFTTKIDNYGAQPANNIVVTETLPVSMTFKSAGMSPQGSFSLGENGHQILYRGAKSRYEEPAVLTYTATVDPKIMGDQVLTGEVEATGDNNYHSDGAFTITVNSFKIFLYLPALLR